MPTQTVKMRSRGFICVNAHPQGCRCNVERQIQQVTRQIPKPLEGAKNVLVVGASTGYGLGSRMVAAWGFGARTLGVFFERAPEGDKTGTAGYYNTVALHEFARRDGLYAASLNVDAFSDDAKRRALDILRREMAPVDLLIYSLAAPKRVHPKTGQVYHSALKPIGQPYTNKTIELDSERVTTVTLPPADAREIADTVAVMGGDDWWLWVQALLEANLLAPGARTLAYSYIGPELTWPIYRDGTIGRAKKDLEEHARQLDALLRNRLGGHAWVSVNKAVVTQASAAIPVVPLYMSLLMRVMREAELEESPLEQMRRLFVDHLAAGRLPALDREGRIRLDDREMRPEVQRQVEARWAEVTTENLSALSDFADFRREFRRLFGFEVEGVDYEAPVETSPGGAPILE